MLFIFELIGAILSIVGPVLFLTLSVAIGILSFILMAAKKVIPALQDEL